MHIYGWRRNMPTLISLVIQGDFFVNSFGNLSSFYFLLV